MKLKLDENLSRRVLLVNDLVLRFARLAPWPELPGCVVVVEGDRVRVRPPAR